MRFAAFCRSSWFFLSGLALVACGGGGGGGSGALPDRDGPGLVEITPVPAWGNDATPSYTFRSDEEGTIAYLGACVSTTTTIVKGENTITLEPLVDGLYDSCRVSVSDKSGNSVELAITPFTIDTVAPTLSQKVAVPTPTNDTTPAYTFTTSEAGAISYGGACSSALSTAVAGDNAITLAALSEGSYSSCSIQLTDAAGNVSALTLNAFVIDTTAPTLSQKVPVPTPTNDTTPAYTFTASEAGALSYSGDCSSTTLDAIEGDNTITFSALTEGAHDNCAISLKDAAGNASSSININSFFIDTTAPALVEKTAITTPTENRYPTYTFTASEAGDIEYIGSCSSLTDRAVAGDNTVALNALSFGVYNDCKIKVTDAVGNASNDLPITAFEIVDVTPPSLEEYSIALEPEDTTTPTYRFFSNEQGDITYGGGCTSSQVHAVNGMNIVVFSPLTPAVYDACTLTVTDDSGNVSVPLNIKPFTIKSFLVSSVMPQLYIAGNEVKVSGRNLSDVSLSLSGSALTPNVQNSHEIRFDIPASLPAGSYDLLLEASNGSEAIPITTRTHITAESGDAGLWHACVIHLGKILCWGDNSYGQLGIGKLGNNSYGNVYHAAVEVVGVTDAVAISAGFQTTCALLGSKTVQCWGSNNNGQLGDGNIYANGATPVNVSSLTNVAQISNNGAYACALLEDKTVWCWGANSSGQLGNGTTTRSATPVQVSGITSAVSVSVGVASACAVLDDQTVKCWGSNSYGALGSGTWVVNSSVPLLVSGIDTALSVSVGDFFACALLSDKTVKCWGTNNDFQLGNSQVSQSMTNVPVQVENVDSAISINGSGGNTCALTDDGSTWCWGLWPNGFEKLDKLVDTSVAKQVMPGGDVTCVIANDDSVRCIGEKSYLGFDILSTTYPDLVTISNLDTVTQIDSGVSSVYSPGGGAATHHCALLADRTVKCWGSNLYASVNDGLTKSTFTAVSVAGLSNVKKIGAGYRSSCALIQDGTVFCWGENYRGQLGNGNNVSSDVPVPVVGITDATDLSVGSGHACALLADTTIKCWGENHEGQLGDESTISRNIPVQVHNVSDAIQVTAGDSQTCAIMSDHTVSCWGQGRYGLLGDGLSTDSVVPVKVSGITSARHLTMGSSGCSLLEDNSVVCWGDSLYGPSPQLVIDDVGSIDTLSNMCAILLNGEAWCMGHNDNNEIVKKSAHGPYRIYNPTKIKNAINVKSVATGSGQTCLLLNDGYVQCRGVVDELENYEDRFSYPVLLP